MAARVAKGRHREVRRRFAGAAIQVTDEEREHLVEDCAFFEASRFRATGPGEVRQEDLGKAAAEIDSVIARPRGGAGRRP